MLMSIEYENVGGSRGEEAGDYLSHMCDTA